MDLSSFKQLLTPEGQWAIESAAAFEPREKDFLADFKMIAKRFPRELARAALETAILRREARSKFPNADKMYFTREAFQQASSWDVSSYRAKRYQDYERVFDLGCSIGSDALALAQITQTTGIDLDPLRLAMAQANAKAVGSRANFIQADLSTPKLPLYPNFNLALFFDPARRKDHQRVFSVEDYTPPLSIIKNWLPDFPNLGIKISPGVMLEELKGYEAEIDFISLKGELKEAVLWFGEMKSAHRRATLLPGPHTLTTEEQPRLPISEPRAFFYEPDPAILRAGLVAAVGAELDAAQLDAEIAYLTADKLTVTPFARVWEVEDWLPFQLKRLRAYLRERNVGKVTVKKRGSPILPEDLIRDLRLEGELEKVIVLTQLDGKPIVVVCKPKIVTYTHEEGK
ncbi:MAG: class I SAM-dependent methyltransferase [Chloroflexi bacterium]|nr:class I SAM-dependent methyltransferase [Chloroflexota bacterium]